MNTIRKKSVLQSEFLIGLIQSELVPLHYQLQSPEQSHLRGSHVALSHPAAWQICQALIKGDRNTPKIIPDFRPPHFIRLGITPLTTRFEDLWWVVIQLKSIVESKVYLHFDSQKKNVT